MPETVISVLVEGGKASAGSALGPALGPTGINIGQVVKEINDKTKEYSGIQVPVKVIVDTAAKTFKINVGSPPVSALIKKEFGVDKLEGVDIPSDYAIKIAKTKKATMLARNDRAAVKEVLGTCNSMKLQVDGKSPREVQKEVDQGKFDAKISGKEPLKLYTREQISELQANLKRIEEEKVKAAEQAKAAADAEKAAAAGEAAPAEAKEGEAPKKEAKEESAKKEPAKKEAAKK